MNKSTTKKMSETVDCEPIQQLEEPGAQIHGMHVDIIGLYPKERCNPDERAPRNYKSKRDPEWGWVGLRRNTTPNDYSLAVAPAADGHPFTSVLSTYITDEWQTLQTDRIGY
jgi:hypothetical protein